MSLHTWRCLPSQPYLWQMGPRCRRKAAAHSWEDMDGTMRHKEWLTLLTGCAKSFSEHISSCSTTLQSGSKSGHPWLWVRLPNAWVLPRLVFFPALKIFLGEFLAYRNPLMIKLLVLLYFVVTKCHWTDASFGGWYTAKRSYSLCLATQILILILTLVYQFSSLDKRPSVECSG